jgi:hypothetical protein
MFCVSASGNPAADRSRLTTNMVARVAAFARRHARSGGDRSLIELAQGLGADTLVHRASRCRRIIIREGAPKCRSDLLLLV